MSKELEKDVETKETTDKVKKSGTKKSDTKKSENKKPVKKSDKNSTKKNSVKVVKENVKKDDETITLEEADSFYHVSLLAQAVCVIGVLFISVLTIFEHSFKVPIEVLVGVTLLIMAYNNVKLFKRKGLTIVYIVFGIISLFVGILGYFGVTL